MYKRQIWNLINNKKILNKIEKILGPEIASNPCQNSRIKQPEKGLAKRNLNDGLVGRTPWHQDAGVMNKKGQKGTELVTCWIPFTKTRIENGCMLAVKESHKFGLVNHDYGSKGQVEVRGKEIIDKLSTVPLEADVGNNIISPTSASRGTVDNLSIISLPLTSTCPLLPKSWLTSPNL